MLAFVPAKALAQTSWVSPAGGTFASPGNWSNGTPTGTVDALFDLSSTYVVSVATAGATDDLTVNQGSVSLSLGTGINLDVLGGLSVNTGASLTLAGSGTVSLGGANGISGAGALNLAGVTIKVSGSELTTSKDLNVVAATGAAVDTTNFDATLSGNISSANAAFVKIGTGTLTLSGASRNVGNFIALQGETVQTEGTTTSGEFMVGSGLTGSVPNNGTFTLEGGAIVIETGTSATASLRVGDFGGVGVMNQNGGTVTINPVGSLNIGNQGGTGTYNLNDGTLTIQGGNSVLGRSEAGKPNSSGTMNVSGGLLEIKQNSSLIIGNNIAGSNVGFGTGLFTQTGGIVRVANDSRLYISGNVNGSGTYNLNGGTLEVGGGSLNARYNNTTSTYAFNLGGGTIKVVGSNLATSVDANLIGGKTSTIDTNGLNATWSGNLVGAGEHQIDYGGSSLIKLGLGTLTFDGASRVLDTFVANGGSTRQTAGATSSVEFLVGSGAGNVGTYLMDGGSLLVNASTNTSGGAVAGSFRIGDFNGTGTFTQTAGSVSFSANSGINIGNRGGVGVYNISGGSLNLSPSLNILGRNDARDGGTAPAYGSSQGTMNISGTGLVSLASGSSLVLSSNIATTVPSIGRNSKGTINQTGGTLRLNSGSNLFLGGAGDGVYNLNGGVLEVAGSGLKGIYNNIGGSYTFNLGGGTIRAINEAMSTSVNANLVGAGKTSVIDTNGQNVAWSGNLIGTGEHQVDYGGTSLQKLGLGTLTWSGSSRVLDTFAMIGGTTRQTAGNTSSVEFMVGTGAGSVGTYLMDGGTLSVNPSTKASDGSTVAGSFRVGDFGGTGTFNQTAGAVNVDGSMNIGNQGGHGTYNLSGGSLNLIEDGQSTLGRTSGSNTTYGGSTGALNISGTGVLNISDTAKLVLSNWYPSTGQVQGNGTLTQTGGTVAVASGAELILTGNGHGVYNLSGGELQIGGSSLQGIYGGESGTYAFNFGGGKLKVVGSDLNTSVNANLVGTGKTSVIDTNGLNATWAGNLTGAGDHQVDYGGTSLQKIGLGTLTWTGSSRVLDTFAMIGGTTRQTAGDTSSVEFMVGTGTGSVGTYLMDGGTLSVSSSTKASDGSVVAGSFRVGDFGGTGTFTQTAGVVNVDGSMNLGNQGGQGTYNLSGGSLNLIEDGQSTLGRTSGSNATYGGSTGALNISGTGVLNISDTAKLVLSNWYPSTGQVQGNGTLTQDGGTVNVGADAELILTGHGHGTYNLNAGVLNIGGDSLIGIYGGESGTYDFNFGGGKLVVTGSDLITSVNANLVGAGKTSVIDTNGLNATWAGNLIGAGLHQVDFGGTSLQKLGLGTLTWSGNSRVLDTFASIGGTTRQTAGTTSSVEFMVGSGLGSTSTYLMDGGILNITPSTRQNGSAVAGSLRVGDYRGTGTFTQTAGTVNVDGSLNIGNQGGHGTYNLSGGALNLINGGASTLGRTSDSNPLYGGSTGDLNVSGTGALNIKDSSVLVLSNWYPNVGLVEGNGTLTQTGGTVNVASAAKLILTGRGHGIYNLNGGELQIGGSSLKGVYDGTSGTYDFNLGGGMIVVTGSDLITSVNANLVGAGQTSTIDTNGLNATWSGNLYAAGEHQVDHGGTRLLKLGAGKLTLSGATRELDTFAANVGTTQQTAGDTSAVEFMVGSGSGNTGEFLMDGGTLTINPSTNSVGGPVAASFRVGDFGGIGTFTQNGGTVTVNPEGALNIGNQGGTGTYDLVDGILNLQGGINVLGRSTGANAASSGTLLIKGGLLDLKQNSSLILGNNTLGAALGTGLVTQTGGTFRVANDSKLFLSGYGNGTYNLDGGSLEIGGSTSLNARYNNPASSYAFNLRGGTLRVIDSDLDTDVDANISGINKKSTIDTNGKNATWSGNLTADGLHQMGNGGTELEKVGAGTLIWDGATRQLDTFAVRGGSTQQTAGATSAVELLVGTGAGNTGSYLIDGGSVTVKASTLADGTSPVAGSLRVGDEGGTGTFTQTAGTVTLASNSTLAIGHSGGQGTYGISGGSLSLSAGQHVIGQNDASDTVASEGVLNISGTALVELASGGSVVLSSSSDTATASVGQASQGTINQTGGTFRVASGADLFLGGDGSGVYNLDGGILEIGGDSLNGTYNNLGGSYSFNVGGGKIKVTGSDLNTAVNVGLKANSSSVIDTALLNATFTGSITGTGNLQKVGIGSLTVEADSSVGSLVLSSGATTFRAGLAASSVSVESGASLHLEGSDNTATGDVTVAAGSELDGAIAADGETLIAGTHDLGTQSITSTGDYLLGTGGVLKLDLAGTDFNVARLTYANITLADGAALLLSYGGAVTALDRIYLFDVTDQLFIGTTVSIQGDGTLAPYSLVLGNDGYITVTAVPEPSVIALLLIGAGAFIAMRLRARRA